MMQASKKVPFEDPTVLNGVRALYVVSNLIIVGIYVYVKMQVDKKKGMSTYNIRASPSVSLASRLEHATNTRLDMTVLKYVEPAPMGSTEEPKAVTTTIHAYDQQQLKSLFRAQLMGVGMMAVMHIYFKYTNPLLIQSIIPVKGAFESNLVKIHLFGQPASGELKRPFKAAAGFMQSGEVKTDKKSIEAAEKAGRGGAKDE
jgi:hypothetical protein